MVGPIEQDIFVRAHTVVRGERSKKEVRHREKWPEVALVFDTETTIDTQQKLTIGAYRICKLVEGKYLTSDEGLFYADDLTDAQSNVLADYVVEKLPQIQVTSFPPKLKLSVYTRSEFVRKIFWKHVQAGALIVGFNLPFDLTRITAKWRKGRTNSWSLILSLRRSRKSGQMEANPERPRIRLRSKDSQSAFISLLRPQRPEEWPKQGRFLDLHTLAFALFGESMNLGALCERLETEPKLDHEPTGKISIAEINYCRADVRATCGALNGLKHEFDLHPVRLSPDLAYSPASIAKSYLHAMGIIPPNKKFKVPNRVLGIAMQAYFGGRAECRIRRVAVPTTHTDFKSQYPTVNTLFGNADVLVAKSISFPDASREVRRLLKTITLEALFDPTLWKQLRFFALIRPQSDFLPVRAFYNEQTVNIGINEFTSTKPIWYAGSDIVASVLLTGKSPRIDKAIRVVPHGKQRGLKPTNLRSIVSVDLRKDDFFRHVVEQRERHKSDESLAGFLKVLANSGSYGLFVEISPEKRSKPVRLKVFSGNESYSTPPSSFVEKHGNWYFPPLASLITAGGRLLLAMLERLVADAGGSYLFCDTDSLCVVGSRRGELIACPGGTHKMPNGVQGIKALSWSQIDAIAQKFSVLNPYDADAVTEILKIEDVNFDARKKRRKLSGFAISAKRYALYEKSGGEMSIIDAKAHGLGYLFPPVERKDDDETPQWILDSWEWLLRGELGLGRTAPAWLNLPAMMRVVLSTPHVLDRLNRLTRPYNFLFCPLIDPVVGYPVNADPQRFTPITPFTKNRKRWARAECINVFDGKVYFLAMRQTSALDRLIPQTYGYVLRSYLHHPESKSLAPDGAPCDGNTRGLLKRASIVAGETQFVGKETDRRWDQGEDMSLLGFKPMVFKRSENAADTTTRNKIPQYGVRRLMRVTSLSQHTIESIRAGRKVRHATLKRLLGGFEHIDTCSAPLRKTEQLS